MHRSITNALLLFTVPALAYPQADIPQIQTQVTSKLSDDSAFWKVIADRPVSYDDVLELLDEIESGSVDDCSYEEMVRVDQFIALLAQQGILPHEREQTFATLNNDIQNLLNPLSMFDCGYSLNGEYFAVPGVFYGDREAILCKSWFKKAWDNTRDFVKHHKKEILIGAAIVVAVAITVTVVVMTCGTAGGGVAAAAGAIAETQLNRETGDNPSVKEPPKQEEICVTAQAPSSDKESETTDSQSNDATLIAAIPSTPLLQEVIADKISSFKETLSEDIVSGEIEIATVESSSFLDQARNLGAYLAHETLDEIANLAVEIPKLTEEIINFTNGVLPGTDGSTRSYLVETFKSRVDSGHQNIDAVFKTDQAKFYTEEGKEIVAAAKPEYTIGILPPPGRLGNGTAVLSEGRLAVTEANSKWGWTVGERIENRTWWGGVPKWSTVRQRYWKNQAEWAKSNPNNKYGAENIPRMQRGLTPERVTTDGRIEKMELHHTPAQRDGGLFDFVEVWPEEHSAMDKYRRLGG